MPDTEPTAFLEHHATRWYRDALAIVGAEDGGAVTPLQQTILREIAAALALASTMVLAALEEPHA